MTITPGNGEGTDTHLIAATPAPQPAPDAHSAAGIYTPPAPADATLMCHYSDRRCEPQRPDGCCEPGQDPARYVAPTVTASPTHGPATRIDRVHVSRLLLPAVTDVRVIDMTGLSDHHTVVLDMDHAVLVDLLSALAT